MEYRNGVFVCSKSLKLDKRRQNRLCRVCKIARSGRQAAVFLDRKTASGPLRLLSVCYRVTERQAGTVIRLERDKRRQIALFAKALEPKDELTIFRQASRNSSLRALEYQDGKLICSRIGNRTSARRLGSVELAIPREPWGTSCRSSR